MNYFFFFLLCIPSLLIAQEKSFTDTNYYEDQLYVGIQYNSFITKTDGLENTGVPYSFELGFIKDMPLNKQRNIGLGLGVGYSFDVLRPNIAFRTNTDQFDFSIESPENDYRYTSHSIVIPFEFRWRTSTPTNDSFWRIYTGTSFVHRLSSKAEFNNTTLDLNTLKTINYNIYTSIGYGTWNFHITYYLNSPFKDNIRTTDGKKLDFNQLKIGIMFYLL